jgi:hypothetical protein
MPTILPLGAVLALTLASCSNSANPFTGPDIEPGRMQEPTSPCELPRDPSGSGTWFNSRVMSSTTGCPPVSPSP